MLKFNRIHSLEAEKSLSELTGINLEMQTPMDADGSIDYARWEELIDS